jgi:predicted dehydrogenase
MAAPTVIGLQARQARAIEFVLELLRDGYVGEVLSTTTVGLSVPGNVGGQPAYMLDKTNGASLLTIGHSRDTLNYVLGEFTDLSALSDLRRPLITIEETGEQIVKRRPTKSRSSASSPQEQAPAFRSEKVWPAVSDQARSDWLTPVLPLIRLIGDSGG